MRNRLWTLLAGAAIAAGAFACGTDPSIRFARLPGGGFNEGAGRIVLNWDAVDNRELGGYFVYIGKRKGGRKLRVNDAPVEKNTLTLEGLSVGERYYFAISTASRTRPIVESRPSPEIEVTAGPAR